jgi:nucleoside-diphosphate-sugar epimerase
MSLYLVTGGAGFIGSHVIESLLEKDEKVRVLDNFSTGKRENLYPFGERVEIIEGDVRDSASCRKAMNNVNYVIHLAALHEVPRSVERPMETHEINVTGILNALIAARDAKAKRFVYASSSAVYGDCPVLPRTEEKVSPVSSPYAASKMAGEHYCRLFSTLYGLETVTLRYFNVYGPRQDASSQYAGVIPKFVSALISDTAPTIYGDGEQSRDFLYVKDCAGATLEACHKEGISGEVMNIGTGRQTTVNQLCRLLQGILDRNIPPVFGPPQPGDIRYDYADVSRANGLLSYQSTWDIHRGLEKTAEWYASCFAGSGK